MPTRLFSHLPADLSRRTLPVDSGQLAVAVLPVTYFTPEQIEAVNRCCVVLDMDAGESVSVEAVAGREPYSGKVTVQSLRVMHGSDLRVPEGAEGWVLVAGDPCYFLDGEYGTDADYGRACNATTSDNDGEGYGFCDLSSGGRAFVSRTVYGDGCYPIRVEGVAFSLALSNDDEDDDDLWDDEVEDDLLDGDEDDVDLDPDAREFLAESQGSDEDEWEDEE